MPGKATFTAPPFGRDQNPNVCGLRVVVTDQFGASTTRNWSYGLKTNAPPTARINTLPDKMLASTSTTPGVLVLSGSQSTDPDTNPTQPLLYSWDQVDPTTGDPIAANSPSRGVFSNPNSRDTTWTAPQGAPYTVAFKLSVTDGIGFPSVAQSTSVKVTTARPGADAGPDRLSHPSQTVSLDGSGSYDALGRPLTYSWAQLSGPPVTLQNALSAQATFVAPHIALGGNSQVMTFELTTRNGLAASFDTVTVVNSPWDAATADAGPPQTVESNATVQLDGTGSSSPAAASLTYHWTQTGGPSVTLVTATLARPAFTAPFIHQADGPTDLTFTLVVNDGYGDSAAATTTVTVNPGLEVPGAPTAVSATTLNGGGRVSFTPPTFTGGTTITGYKATCTSTDGGTTRTASGTESPVTVSQLTNGKTYTCVVRATNSVGDGAPSVDTNSFIPSAPPSVPTDIVPTPGNATISVAFTPGANGGDPNVTFIVSCTSSNGGTARAGYFGASPAVLSTVTNGKTYACVAAAASAAGVSPFSSPSAAVIVGSPTAPGTITASPGAASATVSWTAPTSTNGAAVTGYVLTPYAGATALAPRSFTATTTSAVVSGLTNGTTYTFRVAAQNSRGTGVEAVSPAVTVGAPEAPTGGSAAPGNGQASVNWTAPASTNGSPITGYVVTPYKDGTTPIAPKTFTSTATTQVVTGLTNGSSYRFTVAAVNARGTGATSAQFGLVIVGTPLAPTGVSATAGVKQATVTWTAPANNGSAITSYIVTPFAGTTALSPTTFNSAATTQTVTGLTTGVAYTFRVAAANARGAGPRSTASAAITAK